MNITLYYDDTCRLCTTNAIQMQAHNPQHINIVSVDMGLDELNKVGISRTQAMTYVCIKDQFGNISQGMEAIIILCRVANVRKFGLPISTILSLPIIKQICTISYPFFARNRYYFPRWAIKLIYGTVHEIDNCDNGVCNIPPNKRG